MPHRQRNTFDKQKHTKESPNRWDSFKTVKTHMFQKRFFYICFCCSVEVHLKFGFHVTFATMYYNIDNIVPPATIQHNLVQRCTVQYNAAHSINKNKERTDQKGARPQNGSACNFGSRTITLKTVCFRIVKKKMLQFRGIFRKTITHHITWFDLSTFMSLVPDSVLQHR